jgi:hypothetical protein
MGCGHSQSLGAGFCSITFQDARIASHTHFLTIAGIAIVPITHLFFL